MTYPMTPVELAAELGHEPEARPGLRVRNFLRARYPEHEKNSRWLLSEDQADEVRAYFTKGDGARDPQEALQELLRLIPASRRISRAMYQDLYDRSLEEQETEVDRVAAVLIPIANAIYDLEAALIGQASSELKQKAVAGFFNSIRK